jgi:hypothetical protein
MEGMVHLPARSLSETRRVRYLLGLSSPAEREHIELEYFEDEDAFQEMLTAEDDLIDAYARGELSDEERGRFEESLVTLLRGRERVQFARAFAGAVSATPPIQNKRPSPLTDIFKTFQSPFLLQTATIAVVIVFVAVLAWLVKDRRRITNELRNLRAESAELNKRTEALQRSSNTERTRNGGSAAQVANRRAQPNKSRHPGHVPTAIQPARHLPEMTKERAKFEMIKVVPGQQEQLINSQDASLPSSFEKKKITQLPLEARNIASILTLQPATPSNYVAGARADQANITFADVAVAESLNTFLLLPRNTSGSGGTTIRISSSLSWVRFRIALATLATYEDYRITIKTADGRSVTSVDWIEPLTPHQTIIDTPVISTADLASGDYVLLLVGKEPGGSFDKVAEYSFKVITPQ